MNTELIFGLRCKGLNAMILGSQVRWEVLSISCSVLVLPAHLPAMCFHLSFLPSLSHQGPSALGSISVSSFCQDSVTAGYKHPLLSMVEYVQTHCVYISAALS